MAVIGSAQDRTIKSEFIVWNQFTQKVKFNDKYSGTFLTQYRAFTDREKGYHLFFSLGVTRKLDHGFSVSLGFSNLNINQYVDTDFVLVPELRPFQSIQRTTPINKSSISWRLMIEERFFRNAENGELVNGYFQNWRFRKKLKYTQYISDRFNLILASEIMINAGNVNINIFDQSRTQFLLNYSRERFSIETGYMHWFFQTPTNFHENRHSLVIALTHSI